MVEIKKCYLTKNDCYKSGKAMTPKQIIVHSTGANNKTIKRYVQPDDGIIGVNNNGNDWNRSGVSKCVHAFIGLDKNGKARIYNTLPWTMKSWGCGSGSKGSYNNSAIQFEICEDALTDKAYFNTVFDLAIELCAYLCKTYKIKVSDVVSHHEAHVRGYATDHGDCDHWLKKFGKTMDWFRAEVEKRMNGSTQSTTTSTTTTTKESTKKAYTGTFPVVPPVLKKGSEGTQVKNLQKYLNWYFGKTVVTVDGVFGSGTLTYVKKFQTEQKLTVDGIFGSGSLTKAKSVKK